MTKGPARQSRNQNVSEEVTGYFFDHVTGTGSFLKYKKQPVPGTNQSVKKLPVPGSRLD
jgi:hypothetical protein